MGRTVTETDLVSFIALTGMYEEMFVNVVYARESSVFDGRVVPGQLVHAFAEGLVVLTGALRGTGMALLGAESRFRAPTLVVDTISVDVTVTEMKLTSSQDRGIVTSLNIVRNQRGETVMEISPNRMIRCRRE